MKIRPLNLSRRQILLSGGAAAIASAAFGAVALNDQSYVHRTLKRLVGKVNWGDGEFVAFYTAFRNIEPIPSRLKIAPLQGLEVLGMGRLLSSLTALGISEYQQEFERALLTAFVIGTDYHTADDPSRDPIHFVGFIPTCANPFAQFENRPSGVKRT